MILLRDTALALVALVVIIGGARLLPEIEIRGKYDQQWIEYVTHHCPKEVEARTESSQCVSDALESFFKDLKTHKVADN